MSVLEILEAHIGRQFDSDGMRVCDCGHYLGAEDTIYNRVSARHRAHVAEILDQHMRGQLFRAWNSGFHKGRKTKDGSHISTWPKNPYKEES